MAKNITKIDKNIEKYSLEGLNKKIRGRRTSGSSLRDLADFINKRILEHAITEDDIDLIVDVDGLYHILTSDEVSVGRRSEIEAKLERGHVPVDEVMSDFVSHQTVSYHLNDRLDIDTSRQVTLTKDDAIERINWAQSQSKGIIENTLEQLEKGGLLESRGFEITNSIRVICNSCQETHSLYDFIEQGQCECMTEDSSITDERNSE